MIEVLVVRRWDGGGRVRPDGGWRSGPAFELHADAVMIAVRHVVARAVASRGFFASLDVVLWVEMHIQVVMLFRVTADLAVRRYCFGHLSSFPGNRADATARVRVAVRSDSPCFEVPLVPGQLPKTARAVDISQVEVVNPGRVGRGPNAPAVTASHVGRSR